MACGARRVSSDHAALVLAAGAGRRLGRSKQLLTRDGEPLVRRAARIALQTAPRRCVVVVGADADLVMEALRGLHVEIVRHAGWADGMGTSLAALRAHVHEDTTLRRSLIQKLMCQFEVSIAALEQAGGAAGIIADHGNCEMMVDPATGGPHTAHTTNPVPVIVYRGPQGASLRQGGRLADVAPTVLDLMGLPLPPEMTGQSLIEKPAP